MLEDDSKAEQSTAPSAARKVLRAVAAIVTACVLCLVLVGVSFHIVLNFGISHAIAEQTVDTVNGHVGHDRLVEVADLTLAYVRGDAGVELPRGTDFRTAYDAETISHLDDVTVFIAHIRNTTLVCFPLLIALVAGIWWGERKATGGRRRVLACALVLGGALPILLVSAIGIGCAIDFYATFNFLHGFFFAADSWYFPIDSLLICSLPEAYWEGMGVVLLGSLAAMSLACLIVGIVLLRRARISS